MIHRLFFDTIECLAALSHYPVIDETTSPYFAMFVRLLHVRSLSTLAMILECNHCEAIVEAEVLFTYEDDDQNGPPGKWSFTKCPRCTLPLLAVQVDMGDGYDEPSRVFPAGKRQLGFSVPEPIRIAFSEAQTCFRAKAYTATAIMCRKSLEGICSEHGIKERNLSAALKKLKDNGTIETRLFEWAEALRTLGNEAAHGVNSIISAQDSRDILEFTEALTEYVFTYRDKFASFMKRRAKKPPSDAPADQKT